MWSLIWMETVGHLVNICHHCFQQNICIATWKSRRSHSNSEPLGRKCQSCKKHKCHLKSQHQDAVKANITLTMPSQGHIAKPRQTILTHGHSVPKLRLITPSSLQMAPLSGPATVNTKLGGARPGSATFLHQPTESTCLHTSPPCQELCHWLSIYYIYSHTFHTEREVMSSKQAVKSLETKTVCTEVEGVSRYATIQLCTLYKCSWIKGWSISSHCSPEIYNTALGKRPCTGLCI